MASCRVPSLAVGIPASDWSVMRIYPCFLCEGGGGGRAEGSHRGDKDQAQNWQGGGPQEEVRGFQRGREGAQGGPEDDLGDQRGD
eukprot:1195621-Prorocentrum_minimum.AAC.6